MKSYISVENAGSVSDFASMLNSVEQWSEAWQLPLSIDKCSWMRISNRSNLDNLDFSLSGAKLSVLNEVKDLGVIFSSRMDFSSHIASVISKAKRRAYLIRKCFSSG